MSGIDDARLIDATLALAPADRALLNLWVHHNYGDEELARLIASTPDAVGARREAAVAGLSATVGAPSEAVLDALRRLDPRITAPSREESDRARQPLTQGNRNGTAPAARAELQPESETAAEPEPAAPAIGRRIAIVPTLALLVIVIGVIVLAGSGGSTNHQTAARTARTPAAAAPPAPAASVTRPLATLPGGPPGVAGSLTAQTNGGSTTLTLRVSGLPARPGSHYELWLYNSVIDSVPLGAVPANGVLSVRVPAGRGRFRWLDVSLQPAGATAHSGLSVLRTAVP